MHEMLIKALRDEANEAPAISGVGYSLMRKAADVIEELENMTKARAKGEWVLALHGEFVCSNCGARLNKKANYCPLCGAWMGAWMEGNNG